MQDIRFINSILFKIVYLLLWILVGPNLVTKMSQIVYNSTNNASGSVLLNGGTNKMLLESPEFKASSGSNGSGKDMMSSSAVFSTMIDDQTRFKDNYQLAIKRYINREFELCFDITSELILELLHDKQENNIVGNKLKISNDLIVSVYRLYLSVSDLILKGLANNPDSNEEYLHFKERFLQGCLYTQILHIFDHDIGSMEPELFFLCFMIELSNNYDVGLLTEQVESYLNEVGILPNGGDLLVSEDSEGQNKKVSNIFEKIVELYLIHILVKSNEIEKSKKLISTLFIASDSKVRHYLKSLNDEISTKLKNSVAEEQQLKKEQNEYNNSLQSSHKPNPSMAVTETGGDKRKKKLRKKKSEKKIVHTSGTTGTILENIKRYLVGDLGIQNETLNLISLVKPGMLIVLLLSIILSYKRLAVGKYLTRIRALLLFLLFKLKDTLSMAFKISYI